MTKHKYLVLGRQEASKGSHAGFLFPECVYTLKREQDGLEFQVTLTRSMNWKVGDTVELEDLLVQALQF